jgi:hypothetical protein
VPSYAWLQEALAINSSLSCLGDVVAALAAKAKHVPYRWHMRGSGLSLLLLLLLLMLLLMLLLLMLLMLAFAQGLYLLQKFLLLGKEHLAKESSSEQN